MAWLAGFTKRLKITIPSDNIDSTLTDFPILLKLSTNCGLTSFDASLVFDELELDANRFKIAVTSSDGTTQRYVEIEKWDDSSEIAWLWVKVPSVAASGKTELYFYYDSTASDNTTYVGDIGDAPAQNVWSNNFWAVFHMGDASSPFVSSTTTSGLDLNVSGGTPTFAAPAKVAEAVDWGSSQVAGQGVTGFTASNVTVESWVKQDSAATAVRRYVTVSSEIAVIRQDSGGTGQFKFYIKTGGTIKAMTSNNQVDTDWAYWAGTWDGTTQRMYKDASEIGTPNVPGGALDVGVGMSINSGSENFEGLQDEIRVSTAARPESWLKATYYTCEDNLLYMEEDVTQPEWLGTWDQRIALTINSADIDENIINFPIMLTLASGVGLNGADVTPVFDELDYAFSPDDTFSGTNGDPPDPTKWVDAGGLGAGQIQSNKLRLSVGSGSTESYQYNSTYKLAGDFDVQVDYDIILGPSIANWYLSLTVATMQPLWSEKQRANLYREYQGGHKFEWQTYDGSYWSENSASSSETSGKMRITRVGSTWTAYYDIGGGWVSLGASAYLNETGDVLIRLRLENYAGSNPAVTTDFDNFIVNNGTVIWGNDENYVSSFPNRKKIALTTADGLTQCPVEIDRWEQHDEQALLWAKVPVLSSTENTILYLYYDASQADNDTYIGDLGENAAQDVWDDNFRYVLHLNQEPSTTPKDSARGNSDGTLVNMEDTNFVDTFIGKGLRFDGVNEQVDFPDKQYDYITVETIAKFTVPDPGGGYQWEPMVCKDAASPNRNYSLIHNWTSSNLLATWATSVDGIAVDQRGYVNNAMYNTWRHYAGTFNGSKSILFVDGINRSENPLSGTMFNNSEDIHLAARSAFSTNWWKGDLSEVRISNVGRSEAWIAATYDTCWDNFISYGAPETEPVPSVGTFNGYVELAGQSVARIVALYRRSTGELQDYTTSNPNTGYFELETPYDELHYLVILPDIADGYQPMTRDQIDPV